MSDKFQNKYRIQSARAQWWNYGWNAIYFVTICTANRECFFGEIINGIPVETGHCPVSTHDPVSTNTNPINQPTNIENQNVMQLSEIGQLAEKFWLSIPEHFPFVKLDVFVVMPNHIHGILIIDKPEDERDRDGMDDRGDRVIRVGGFVETGQCPVSTSIPSIPSIPKPSDETNSIPDPKTPGELRFRNQGKETLSSIVGSFKSIVTKHAHRIHADFEWQERFHDHIIRDSDEYLRIANYIENNVTNWTDDKFYES
jgi:putative transposase